MSSSSGSTGKCSGQVASVSQTSTHHPAGQHIVTKETQRASTTPGPRAPTRAHGAELRPDVASPAPTPGFGNYG